MRLNAIRRGLVILGLFALLTGCGPDDGMVTIYGSITLDGEPVEDGSISLMPLDGGSMGGGIIADGEYTARSAPGPMAVQIHATKMVKKTNPTREEIERGLTEDPVNIIPKSYNQQSQLRITVSPDQTNFSFKLTKDGKIPDGMEAKM